MNDQVYSVEVFSPENRASDVLPIELWSREQAEGIVKTLAIHGMNSRVVRRGRWGAS